MKGLILGCTLRDTTATGGLGVLEQLIRSKHETTKVKQINNSGARAIFILSSLSLKNPYCIVKYIEILYTKSVRILAAQISNFRFRA